MGFFDFFRKLTGTSEDSRIKKLSIRIGELFQEKSKIIQKQKMINSSVDTSWYKLTPIKKNSAQIKDFSPPKFENVRTMAGLLERREKEEIERKHLIRSTLTDTYAQISKQIKLELADKAEGLLYEVSPLVKELNEESFERRFSELLCDIKQLKEILCKRESKRKAEEKQRLAEEKARKEKLEAERKEQCHQQQLEKERKAREYEEQLARAETKIAEERERLYSIVTQSKSNSNAYLNHLRLHGVKYFYHFTDERNINSIRKLGGLYSWYYCSQHGIEIPNPGGDSQSRNLDTRYDLQDYVRLSFCNDHPMAFRKHKEGARLVLLKIKIDVAAFRDTAFSDMNAADSDHTHGSELKDLQRVDIGATKKSFVRRDDPDFHTHQAECMVKTFVPIKYIENISHPNRMQF